MIGLNVSCESANRIPKLEHKENYGRARGTLIRSFTRITNFRPDHTSLTAHTFTSTRAAAKPILLTSFSFRSVTTPEVFLGQLTHSIPAGAKRRENLGNCSFMSA